MLAKSGGVKNFLASNQMEQVEIKVLTHVESMLDIWARWAKIGVYSGLGFSRLSNLGWIQEMGGVYTNSPGARYPTSDPIAEKMDKWISQLVNEHPKEGEAIVLYYIGDFYKENEIAGRPVRIKSPPIKEVLARRLKTSVRTVDARIKTGKTWLEGRYCSEEKYF